MKVNICCLCSGLSLQTEDIGYFDDEDNVKADGDSLGDFAEDVQQEQAKKYSTKDRQTSVQLCTDCDSRHLRMLCSVVCRHEDAVVGSSQLVPVWAQNH